MTADTDSDGSSIEPAESEQQALSSRIVLDELEVWGEYPAFVTGTVWDGVRDLVELELELKHGTITTSLEPEAAKAVADGLYQAVEECKAAEE